MPVVNAYVPEVAEVQSSSSNKGDKVDSGPNTDTGDERETIPLTMDHGETGMVTNSSGSARIRVGSSEIICAVYGPKASQKLSLVESTGQLECDICFAPFVEKPAMDSKDDSDTSLEKYMAGIVVESLRSSLMLEKYPKMVISIAVNVISSSANTNFDIGTAVTCASLALADASIAMYDLVTACTALLGGRTRNSNCVTVATMQGRAQITNILFTGRNAGSELAQAVKQCCENNAAIRARGRVLLETGLV